MRQKKDKCDGKRSIFLCCYKSVLNGFWHRYKDGATWKVGHDNHETKATKQQSNTQNKNLECHSAFGGKKNQLQNPSEHSNTCPFHLHRSFMMLPQKNIKFKVQFEPFTPQPLKNSLQPPPLDPTHFLPDPINWHLCLPSCM